MSARAFCTVTASTSRNADLGSGRTGAPATNLASLLITPLWPVERDTIQQLDINSPREYKECYHVPTNGGALPDVVEGDVLTVGAVGYRVHHVAEWPDITGGSVSSLHIVVQEIRGT